MINTKKLLDSVMLDKLKLDGEVEIDEEEATQEVIRSYNTIREKERPRSFHSSYPPQVQTILKLVRPDQKDPVNTRPWRKICSHMFITNFCIGELVTELLSLLNNMGYAEEIEEMLEIKVYEMGGDEEIFTSEAWRRVFDINELVYAKLCHEFYATYEFDEIVIDKDLMSKKLIKFRLGGCGHTLTIWGCILVMKSMMRDLKLIFLEV
ncbi:hypothetical protein Tco_1089209 [Tanacetum coccineum]